MSLCRRPSCSSACSLGQPATYFLILSFVSILRQLEAAFSCPLLFLAEVFILLSSLSSADQLSAPWHHRYELNHLHRLIPFRLQPQLDFCVALVLAAGEASALHAIASLATLLVFTPSTF